MTIKKLAISLILLFALMLSMLGGFIPAYATESLDAIPENEAPEVAMLEDAETESAEPEEAEPEIQPASTDPFIDFALRMYLKALDRDADPVGLLNYSNALRTGARDGASVAREFFFSEEIIKADISTEEFVRRLYVALLDRDGWPEEIAGWSARIGDGYLREDLFAGFVNSTEFINLCTRYGIKHVRYTPPNTGTVRAFVTRLYMSVLERPPDPVGLVAHSTAIIRGRTGVSAAHEFFFSEEFMVNKRVSNERFVELLYSTLFDRDAWPEEVEGWAAYLYLGYPREFVYAGIANSPEFDTVCRSWGITRGLYTPPPGMNIKLFITHMFRFTVGLPGNLWHAPYWSGGPGPGGGQWVEWDPWKKWDTFAFEKDLEHWFAAITSGRATGASFAHDLIFSDRMNINYPRWNSQPGRWETEPYIKMLYRSMLFRGPDNISDDEIQQMADLLQNGASRHGIYAAIANSAEFNNVCRNHGVTRGTSTAASTVMPVTGNNDREAKVWNMIRGANFPGISDRPEHIAGIIGNIKAETGYQMCPFQQQVGGTRAGLGLMQWTGTRRTAMENHMWNNGISEVDFIRERNKHLDTTDCTYDHGTIFTDRVMEAQISFMFSELNSSEALYRSYIDHPSNRTGVAGARAYAELFCVLVLRPGAGTGTINNIDDPGVRDALRASPYEGGAGVLNRVSYSQLNNRRAEAEYIFWRYINSHS